MLDEQLEFRITQYLDGTLPPEECVLLEGELEHNEAARAALEAYRKLAGAMAGLPALPEVEWDQLAGRISMAVTQQETASVPEAQRRAAPESYRMPWVRTFGWLAAAACILIAVGVAFQLMHVSSPKQAVSPAGMLVQVTGPQAEPSAGPAVAQVSIGPAPALASRSDLPMEGDTLLNPPSQLLIASGPETIQDIDQLY